MANPRIGSTIKIKSTGETGKITGYMTMRSGEKIFLIHLDKPDSDGNEGTRARYFDVEVIPKSLKKKEAR